MKDYKVRRYSFEELEGEARERAVTELRQSLGELDFSYELTEYLSEYVDAALGGVNSQLDLRYSLGYCQGDGVALYGRVDRENAPDLSWPEGASYAELSRNQWSHQYSHYNSFNVEVFNSEDEEVEVGYIEVQLRDLCRELTRVGYNFIEGMSSEELAIEQLREADAVFTIEGKWDVPVGIVEEVEL